MDHDELKKLEQERASETNASMKRFEDSIQRSKVKFAERQQAEEENRKMRHVVNNKGGSQRNL